MKIVKYSEQPVLEQPKCFLLGYKLVEAILMLGILGVISVCYTGIGLIFQYFQ